MPLRAVEVPEPDDGWVFPSPSRSLSQSERKERELELQSRSWDLGNSIVNIPSTFDREKFVDLLDDIQDAATSTEEKHKSLQAIYPPQEIFNSNVLILQKDSHHESENASFINVLRTAYGSDSAQTGVNTFRVNLVLKGLKTVHSFDFPDESDYWKFLCGIRKGNRGEMDNYVTGVCRLVGAHGDEDSASSNKTLLGFHIGKLPKLTTTGKGANDGQGRFVISHNILTFKMFGPKGQFLDDEEIINLMDIWALAITSDLATVQSHSLLLQAELPEAVLKKGHNLANFVFQLSDNVTKMSYPGKVYNLPVTVFPVGNKPSLFAVIPTSLSEASSFICRGNQVQELLLEIRDTAHQVDIGHQTFTTNQFATEYKPIVDNPISFGTGVSSSNLASGTYSPKPTRRSSGLSSVRFTSNDMDVSSNTRSSFDFNNTGVTTASYTSSHRNSGKFTLNDPVIKLNTTQRIETLLLSKGGERALKLEIKRASGLISTNGKAPSVYCTIYLAGKDGKRLTSNVAEMRTDPVKSLDPEWNHEIIIHDERLAKQEVEFVMVLLRDQASGLLKHRHVGQVMIPLSCFLDTSAEFCLPIEPSYRMDNALSQTSYIGDIHLMTHMVRGEATTDPLHNRGSITHGIKHNDPKIFRVDSLRMTTFPSSVTLFRHGTGSTWWPAKLLHPSSAAFSSASLAAGIGLTSMNGSHATNANLSVNLGGSVVNTPTYFSGFVLPASEALILAISNPLDFHYLPVSATNSTMVHLEVLWSDVLDVEVLSDNAMFLSLQLPPMSSSSSGTSAAESSSSPGAAEKKIVEFLVGPCVAQKLVALIHRRKRFQNISLNMAAIQLFKIHAVPSVLLTTSSTSVASTTINSGPNSPLNPTKSRSSSVSRSSIFSASAANTAMVNISATSGSVTRLAANQTNTYGVVETIRDMAEMIESLYKDLLEDSGPDDSKVEQDPIWEQMLLRQMGVYLRCKLVPLLLPFIPDGEELPDFSIAYIQKAVEKDKMFYQMLIPLRVNEKMEALNERYDLFMEEVARRIRDFVLFSSRVTAEVPYGAASAADANTVASEDDIPKEARFCIQVLTEKYHEVLVQSLRPYVQNKPTFQAIQGQWLKNCVLKLLIEKNHQFGEVITTSLRMHGLHSQPQHTTSLTLVDNIEEVLDWFATALLQDTRLWLSKTIEQAHSKRENPYDLPWDTELVGDRICSHLPESVSFQLKVFMDVCVKDFGSNKSRHHHYPQEASASSNSAGASAATDAPLSRALFSSSYVHKSEFYQVANERLLQAIAQAWILLSNEYERCLLSKHWDQVRPKAEQDAYVDYLCAIANDCYRIRRDQIMALTDIRVKETRKNDILNHLHNLFRNLQTQAIGYIMRIVYSTVQRTLIDFEDLWLNPTEEQHSMSTSYATRALLTNLRTWMLRMKNKLEYKVYRELLPNCIEVIVLRFFVLFRETLAQKNGPPLRSEDIAKLTVDVEIMSSMLEDLCEHDGDASFDGLDTVKLNRNKAANGYWVKDINLDESSARAIGPKLVDDCVKDVLMFFHTFVMLLREPLSSKQFNASLNWLLYDYEHIYYANHPPYFVEFLLVHCVVPLRPPQSSTDIDGFIHQYHQMASVVPPRTNGDNKDSSSKGSNAAATSSNSINGNTATVAAGSSRKPRRNLDQHDLFWRIFGGNNKILDSMAEAYDAAGGSMSVFTATLAANGVGTAGAAPAGAAASASTANSNAFKFFSPNLATKRMGLTASSATSAAAAKATGGDIFKPLREKAADLRVFHNQRRQNEEIMAIFRLIGLGGSANDEESPGEDSAVSASKDSGNKLRPAKGPFGSFSHESDAKHDIAEGISAHHAGNAGSSAASSGAIAINAPRTLISLVTSVTGSSSQLIPSNAHGTSYTGFIKITHIEVRKLHSAALFGECHPYIYFTMGLQRQKTSVKANCHNAVWDDIIALKIPSTLDVTTATLHVEVYDKELIRRKRLLGEVTIKLDGLDMRDFDSWFALEGGECAGVGEIHVKMSLQKLT